MKIQELLNTLICMATELSKEGVCDVQINHGFNVGNIKITRLNITNGHDYEKMLDFIKIIDNHSSSAELNCEDNLPYTSFFLFDKGDEEYYIEIDIDAIIF